MVRKSFSTINQQRGNLTHQPLRLMDRIELSFREDIAHPSKMLANNLVFFFLPKGKSWFGHYRLYPYTLVNCMIQYTTIHYLLYSSKTSLTVCPSNISFPTTSLIAYIVEWAHSSGGPRQTDIALVVFRSYDKGCEKYKTSGRAAASSIYLILEQYCPTKPSTLKSEDTDQGSNWTWYSVI